MDGLHSHPRNCFHRPYAFGQDPWFKTDHLAGCSKHQAWSARSPTFAVTVVRMNEEPVGVKRKARDCPNRTRFS